MATSIFRDYFKGYEILGELGRGNARVLKARHVQTGKLVAIKHFAFNTDVDTLRRFQRESEIMKSIMHNCVVKVIDVHLDAELPYLVMELIEGGDVRSLLKADHTLDLPTVITLARQITAALHSIHQKDIVHRDIKPENIMYRRLSNGELQFLLTDFGIARLREQADSITVTGSSMLTYDYASPEQFSQPKQVNAATDYYSLGIVLYECITGMVPFEYEQDDLLLHINRVISAPLPIPYLPDGTRPPAAMLQLLEGLLRKQAARRLSDPYSIDRLLDAANTFADDGQAQLQNCPAVTQSYFQQTFPSRKKHPWRWVLSAVLLIAGLFYSWTTITHHNRTRQAPIVTPTKATTAVEPKSIYLPASTHVVHSRHTPSPTTNVDLLTPGIPLVNGVYYNDFDQQDTTWNTGADDNSEFILLDGKYIMKGFNDSLSYSSFIKLDIDTEKNFSIAAAAFHEGAGSSDPFGIIFCGDETRDAFFVCYLTSNGYYSIGTSVRDQWTTLIDWTASPNIRPDAGMNLFAIEKKDGLLRLLINGEVERVMPFHRGFGKYFGLRTDGAQTVGFDQFIVKGTSFTNTHQ